MAISHWSFLRKQHCTCAKCVLIYSMNMQWCVYGTHIQYQDPTKEATAALSTCDTICFTSAPKMRRLSDDANFIFYVSFVSVVCDCSLCTFTKGRGLTLVFARVLVRATYR